MKFTTEDIAFMDSLNNTGVVESNIYITAQHGYMRNLDRGKLKGLEAIYKRVINEKYILCYTCGHEVMNLVLELYRELDKQKATEIVPLAEVLPKPVNPVKVKFKDIE